MRLSVVIPALNEAAVIPELLHALAPLRQAGHEVIVVDGGSRDATTAIAAPLADRVLTAPRGRAVQMNAGAAGATGALFWFLHADTVPTREALAAMRAMAADERIWGRFDVFIEGESRWLPVIARGMNLRSRFSGVATGDQGIFVSRELFETVGGFPPIALMEDVAISRLLRRRQAPLCLRQTIRTSGRRWECRGVWRTVLLMWRLRLAYFLGADPESLARSYR